MNPRPTPVLIAAILCAAAPVLGGIPEPDAILYGTVSYDTFVVTASDNVSIIARVNVDRPPTGNFPGPEDSVQQEVGRYQMGDEPAASGQCSGDDCYALHVRLESLSDGATQSTTAALVGQNATIYVQAGAGPEANSGFTFALTERGKVQNHNFPLPCLKGDVGGVGVATAPDGVVNFDDLDEFVTAILDGPSETLEACSADIGGLAGSMTPDGKVDGLDIRGFVECLLGIGCS